jgi:hypothetical protein
MQNKQDEVASHAAAYLTLSTPLSYSHSSAGLSQHVSDEKEMSKSLGNNQSVRQNFGPNIAALSPHSPTKPRQLGNRFKNTDLITTINQNHIHQVLEAVTKLHASRPQKDLAPYHAAISHQHNVTSFAAL